MPNINSIETLGPAEGGVEQLEDSQKINKLEFGRLLGAEDYKSIEEHMKSRFGDYEWGHYSGDFARFVENESEYLIKGTFKLIEKVVEAGRNGEPYDSVVFLDKSARPGAYLYREMIDMLTEKGYIEKNIKLPNVKFMDVGKVGEERKIKSEITSEYAREKMSPKFIGKKVLIVDEFRDSGVTLSNALGEFKSVYGNHIKDLKLDSIYQFSENGVAPFWYRDSSTKSLVRDADILGFLNAVDEALKNNSEDPLNKYTHNYSYKDENGNEVKKSMDYYLNANLKDIRSYRSLSEKLSKEVFVSLFDKVEKGSDYQDLEDIIEKSSPLVDVELTKKELEAVLKSRDINIIPGSLYDYFKYAGGRFAAPYHGDRESGLELREMLKTLTELVEERI
jgi:hypoxanthine phosphoribosyltransferase